MRYILTTLFFICCLSAYSQTESVSNNIVDTSSLPDVFLIGEHETAYEQLVQNSGDMLLTVCDESMDEAFNKWNIMLLEMQSYADELSFDIKGIKIWINVFWDPSGAIRHIVFYPKPNSKNIDYQELTAFFKNFIKVYKIPVQHESRFSHYGIASFPTFAKVTSKG